MAIWSKIGKALKKIAPIAAPLAAFIPGVGPAIAGGISGLSSAFSGSQLPDTDPGGLWGANSGGAAGSNVQINGSSMPPNFAAMVGPAISGGLSYLGQRSANAANAQQAQRQMDFQAEQSSTSYQRGVADMKKAGINPIMAYSQGGASAGTGASAEMHNDLGEGANSASSALQTIMQMQSAIAGIDKLNADTSVSEAQAKYVKAQTLSELNRPENIIATTKATEKGTEKGEAEIRAILLQNELLRETMEDQKSTIHSASQLKNYEQQKARYGLSEGRAMSDFWDSSVGRASPYIRLGGETVNSAADAIGKMIKPRVTINRR